MRQRELARHRLASRVRNPSLLLASTPMILAMTEELAPGELRDRGPSGAQHRVDFESA